MFEKLDHKKSLGVWWASPAPVPMLHLSSLACTCCMEHALKLWKNTGNKNCLCARKDGLLRTCCLPAVQNGAKNTIKKSLQTTLSYAWMYMVKTYHTADSQEDTMTYDRTIKKFATPYLSQVSHETGHNHLACISRFLPNQASICKRFTSSLARFTRKRHSN